MNACTRCAIARRIQAWMPMRTRNNVLAAENVDHAFATHPKHNHWESAAATVYSN